MADHSAMHGSKAMLLSIDMMTRWQKKKRLQTQIEAHGHQNGHLSRLQQALAKSARAPGRH
jgi:hypothetical protein